MKHSPGDAGGFGPRTIPPPPVSYQGGKRRLAPVILDAIRPDPAAPFFDLCCGGGAVALEAVRRGHPPTQVTLVDVGPWGEVWRAVGTGRFPLATLRALIAEVPDSRKEPRKVCDHLSWLARQCCAKGDRPAVFLLLQAGSWGGRAVGWSEKGGWRHSGFHPGIQPTATSVRRYPTLPLHPTPETIYDRMARICDVLVGVRGIHGDVRAVRPGGCGVAYLDPPYQGTAGYPATGLDASAFASSLDIPCWVSEGVALSSHAVRLPLRRAAGISGGHKARREEWLSLVAGAAPPRTPLPLTSGVSAASPTESENR